MSEIDEATGSHEDHSPDVLQPHTRADFVRVGWVIALCSIPVAVVGYRFFHQRHEEVAAAAQNLNAALMFWFIAGMLATVGSTIVFKTLRGRQDAS